MKLVMDKISDKVLFYDEVIGISRQYYRKIIKNPYKKIGSATKTSTLHLLLFIIFTLLIILFMMIDAVSLELGWFALGCYILGIFFQIALLINVRKTINKAVTRDTLCEIIINKDEVIFENKVVGRVVKLKWDDVNFILIADRSISFLPKKNVVGENAIFCSRDYEKEILEMISRYDRDNLIIRN